MYLYLIKRKGDGMFQKAVPIWVESKTYKDKLNKHLIFREMVDNIEGQCKLKIAAVDWYKLYINGVYVGAGPARSALGYARVDEYDLSKIENCADKNEIVVYVGGFYSKSLASVRQDSFFSAEIVCGDDVVKYTGRDFECFVNARRVRNVERFSVQRYFQEVMDETADEFGEQIKTVTVKNDIQFIPRKVPFAHSTCIDCNETVRQGTFEENPTKQISKNAYSFDPFNELAWGVFEESEIAYFPFRYVKSLDLNYVSSKNSLPVTLCEGQWAMLDMDMIYAGFLYWSGVVEADADVVVAFSEIADGNLFQFGNINMQSVFEYVIPAGKTVNTESFEPYTAKYIAFFVKKGSITINGVGIRSFERDITNTRKYHFKKPAFRKLYDAALRSFAHNAVDIFTDCPSRERAGWLCDSYFTAKAEYFFFGNTCIEDNFLENYLLYSNRGEFPEGVLPMCYPSEPHQNNKFIPQWNLWYILEVCDYLKNRKPECDKNIFTKTIFGVLEFLKQYENSLGLLENLPSWNFIEWSSANTWTKDINFPTNMLYAGALENVAAVYDKPDLALKADKIRKTVCVMSFDGEVFVDNATKKPDGTYICTKNVSEACQYYAILFGGIDTQDDTYSVLMNHVKTGFAKFDKRDRAFCPINAFIGLYLKMNVLSKLGYKDAIEHNVKGFFGEMCDKTGTLWEYKEPVGSLDHGFASYVATLLPYEKEYK